MNAYLCGNCCTPTRPFADTEGNAGQECPACGALWYDWELQRAIRWQQQAEEPNARRIANRALQAATSQPAFSFQKRAISDNR